MALGRVVVTLLVVDGVAVRLVDEVLPVVVTARVELPGLVVDGLVVRVVDDVVVRVGVVLVGLVEEPVLRAGAVAEFLVGVVTVVLVGVVTVVLVGVVTVVLVGLVAVVLVVPFVVRTGVRRVVPALVVAEAVRVVAFVSPVYLDVDEPLLAALADEPEEVILVDDVLVLRLERLAIPKPDPPPE